MAAPKGNRFWEQASTHGREEIFSSPTLFWEACKEYFEWCEDNAMIEIDFRGKDADEVAIPKMRSFTIKGLCLFIGCNEKYLYDLEDRYKTADDERGKEYSEYITRVRDVIYVQKFTGAAAGFLNPNIIARDLGLTDKKDLTTGGDKMIPHPAITLADGTNLEL